LQQVVELREELVARNLSPKGLRLQLIARLNKVLKQEQENEEEKKTGEKQTAQTEDKKKAEEESKNKEKEVGNISIILDILCS